MEAQSRLGAIVLAGGRSTRFRSATSKLLHPLAGRPLIQWALESLRPLAADPVAVVIGARGDAVQAACGTGFRFAVQRDQRGTGHATLMARATFADFAGDVIVLYADLPLLSSQSLQRLATTHREISADLSLMTATVADPSGWGRVLRRDGRVSAIVEDRDADATVRAVREVNVGIYCASPTLIFRLLDRVTPDNAQGEIYLTDIVAGAVADGLRIGDVRVDPEEVTQVNSRAELAAAEHLLRTRINAGWMDAGVTLQDPDTTYIEPEVRIGADTVIGANVHLRGRTTVGQGCRFDGTAYVTDSNVGDGVHVKFGVVMTEATVGPACQIGPFAQLRPGTRLAADVHIGNFVETKKAVIGARTKANHLAYLGDAEVGSETNIGAGTITCNYDGIEKHRTVIGDRVQVGSDSTLVAPVTVADDAYVATATTVREDVPAGALVFNRRDEVHRPGWVKAFRARTKGPGEERSRGSRARNKKR